MDNSKQYAIEMQQRYLKYLQRENENENKLLQKMVEKDDRKKRRIKKVRDDPGYEDAELTMNRNVRPRFRVYNIILDSDHRDRNAYPNLNDFTLRLQEALRDVAAVRLMRTEFYSPSNTFGYFVINEARVPLQIYNVEHAYLYLNGYISTAVANDSNIALFGRVGPGTEFYPAISADPLLDPYIYVMRPVEPRLRRFQVKLLKADGSLYEIGNARIIMTLAVYCLV